ncbi:hypothetical protein BU24DRAFT_423649 [Aaosphaeria arxii CBS 175.79]|uniref:R3H domain-containing protein n=1 Tax=Aaosphaeria arxii CBS 175.79 TaxID=1450172 RepID=A0A6A5XR18_9PLEO|nr:uncharacterized protein BU24DRAFT_423649 [Aaosphaeria arxii CBS 175.79]KAF2014744.1 hypothetical protein BU24DRAFT_423649 [Aaosphaeria arxii CBS 175.79]
MSSTVAEPAPADATRGSQRRRRPRNRGGGQATTTSESAPQQGQTDTAASSSQQQSRRGGRGPRASQGQGGRNNRNQETRTQMQDGTSRNSPADGSAVSARGGRAGRGRGRGGPPASRNMQTGPGGRRFGGQLTDENASQTTEPKDLRADAPAFEPGQASDTIPKGPRSKPPVAHSRVKAPKSTATDIATRTHEDIDNGYYECAVCYQELKRRSRVWSCRTCWTVFHLGCIKEWSGKEGSSVARPQLADGEEPAPRQWRCPGCNLPKDVLPKHFTCWCEKEVEPKPLPGLPPFSCGQTCARSRIVPKRCPHPCPDICHAGPCAPCTQMGPIQFCFCGKKSVTRRCIDTDYENGWSCGEDCGELMPCGIHSCTRPCHEGLCGACEVRVPARCFCGQLSKEILCCDREEEAESSQSHISIDGSITIEHWTGLFQCPDACGRLFDCGKHRCEKPCHPQDSDQSHCPRSPDLVSHCPCGKTLLTMITEKPRLSCEDPIPNCSEPCNKLLPCGHRCQKLCHQGECSSCLQSMSIPCRCGRTQSLTICHQGVEELPQCMRVCRVSLNCGRHECGERCCSGERKASERQAARRKPRSLDAPRRPAENFEAEHICTRSCGRPLKCGNPDHRCQELCHKGACGTCREAIFDEVSCNCGRTVLQPPLPCGTSPPPCRYQCERSKDCGHPQVAHNCHQDEESCPKCPFLTTKHCLCGKSTLKNQPCWLSEVRCGEICGRTLKCGVHKCRKQCHRSGECEEPCRQPCGKELSVCGHPCMAPCHAPAACMEDTPCQQKMLVTCECQRIKQELKCNASKNGTGNLNNVLKCDAECARLERNRKLALALNVDPEAQQNDHIPYSAETLNMYQGNSTWAAAQEKIFRTFASDPAEKRLRFKPMPANQRAFLHSIAEDFGFDHESMDPEPHRHVFIFKTPRFVMAPMKTLAECARVRQVQRVGTAGASTVSTTVPSTRPKPLSGDPFNSYLITKPRFALTVEEVNSAAKAALAKTQFPLELEVHFLPSEDVVLQLPFSARANITDSEMQTRLESIKPVLSQTITSQKIGTLQLARVDSSLNVIRKENDVNASGSGWSEIARKGAPARRAEKSMPVGNRGGFAVLSLSSAKKKKEKAAEVVDDWETAELLEEEKERVNEANSAIASEDEDRGSTNPARNEGFGTEGSIGEGISTRPTEVRWADLDEE